MKGKNAEGALIYLASPYSHPSKQIRMERFWEVCRVAGRLMNEGYIIFSPIAHTHPIAMEGNLPTDWEFWKKYDEEFIRACEELWVVKMDGYKESKGVQAEIWMAETAGKPIKFIDP